MKRDVGRLHGENFDVLVFGGGVYGAWVAYDAALRGLKVALVEQGDWAAATSSNSSKLVHGGLRYLETFDLKVVKKSLAERQMLLEAAPHRVWPLRFGVPVYADSRVGALRLKAGLTLYDLLAGNPGREMAHRHFGREAFAERFPILDTSGLKGGFTYADAQTDDARLVLELIDGAMSSGAVCVNYCRMDKVLEENGKAAAAVLEDRLTGETFEVRARQFVDTTGYWMARAADIKCRLTKGVHLVLPGSGLHEALLLTARSDGRVFFIIPWYGRTLVGTTDTDYRGDVAHVTADADDVAYLLAAANGYLGKAWTPKDVIGSFAGLRALKYSDVAAPSAASRGWKLEVAPNGVHYSIGGKLTSAREDAVSIVDSLCGRLGVRRATATRGKPFPWKPERTSIGASSTGTVGGLQSRAVQLGLDEECAVWLVRRHGRRAGAVLDIVKADAHMGRRVVEDLAITYADLLYCAREEMAVHLVDLLRRRTPLLILSKLGEPELRQIAGAVASAFGWSAADIEREIKDCANP